MTGVDPVVLKLEACLAEVVETEESAAARVKELTESLNTARIAQSVGREADRAAELEKRLEGLKWTEAASHKCDYTKDAPADLVAAVRGSKDGIKGMVHRFASSPTEPTLFRFKRSTKV